MPILPTARDFLERATHEAKRYGDDPWVFLRELVQNSRDAQASSIKFTTRFDKGWMILSCQDNGIGMSPQDVEDYLLCLYASKKNEAVYDVGFFGVGFWSVLLFEPEMIRVSTRCAGAEVHGFEIWPNTSELKPYRGSLRGNGTRISLYRREDYPFCENLNLTLKARLTYYACYVRPRQGVSQLNLEFNKVVINRSMQAQMTYGEPFRTKDFDGMIGFGPKPYVRLYKGGLLVRDLASLKQVIPSRRSNYENKFPGLHPTVDANIDRIQVLMDRQMIFEDELLHGFVDFCEERLSQMSHRLIKQVFPMDWRNRLQWLRNRLKMRYVGLALALAALALLGLALLRPAPQNHLQDRPNPVQAAQLRPIDSLMTQWNPALIDPPGATPIHWDFRYEGADHMLFRLRTLADFDPEKGLQVSSILVEGPYLERKIPAGAIVKAQLGIKRINQPLTLPVPPNHAVFTDSVKIDGLVQKLFSNQFGEPTILPSQLGTLSYEMGPMADDFVPQRIELNGSWPSAYARVLDQLRTKPTDQQVASLTTFLQAEITYARDAITAAKYRQGSGPWIERVAETGAGDCDIINGLLVLMLRELEIPAVLCAGLVGQNGEAHSDLHAWAYYYHEGWKHLDLTPLQFEPSATLASPIQRAQMPEASATPASKQRRLPHLARPVPLLIFSLAGLSLVAGLVYWLRQRRNHELTDKQLNRCLSEMIQSHFASADVADPFQFRFRPAIRLLDGSRISIQQLSSQCSQGSILGGTAFSPIINELEDKVPILDLAGPGVSVLLNFIPAITHLNELASVLRPAPLPLHLQVAEDLIRSHDPKFRIHLVEGRTLKELNLAFKNKDLGQHHLFIGTRHRLYFKLKAMRQAHPLSVVHLLLLRSTFFLADAAQIFQKLTQHLEEKRE